MANRLLTVNEAVASFKQDVDALLAECKTTDERKAVMEDIQRWLLTMPMQPDNGSEVK